ncbi:MAG: CDP-alcohol phosphatidyltransferase family protein [Halarcobacter sp.]
MSHEESRRPLKVRSTAWSKNIASFLSKQNITPNQISLASIFFSILASICILLITKSETNTNIWVWSILSAVFIQMRLLCNLFDGMVALEGGKSTKSGELYNDIPDRVSDSILFIALGYSTSYIEIGYLASLFAMMTAYVRVLGASMNAGSIFIGPMAKQHRMAILTICSLITPLENMFIEHSYYVLSFALFIIMLGSVLTVVNRAYNIYKILEAK